MKLNITKIVAVSIALTMFATIVTAEKQKERTYTLPDGRVLVNPFVISTNPDGLEVGHNNGIIQLKFKDLPKDIQKKYGYSPEKAAAYKKQKAKREKERKKREAQAARNKKIQDEKFRRYRRNVSIEKMEIDIKKMENRIAELKREIPKLEKSLKDLLNKTTDIASTPVSENSNSGYTSWFGGYSYNSNNAGKRAERTKQRQISNLDDKYATTEHRLRTYKKELAKKEIDIIKLKRRYDKKKNK